MSILNLITLLGGLGLFLYGMKIMGDGLEKAAGDRLQKIIETMTSNIFKGVLVGTAVTAIIQSSSATTVMVVGFVNAGIMRLTQTVGVIMGANIGTTVTAQIIRLGDIDKGAWYLTAFKPATLAPLAVALGAVFVMFAKRKKLNTIGEILVGFGTLFIGMGIMETSVQGLKDLPAFQNAFSTFSNPIIGVLIGAGVTAIIQSSSASIGILQAVSSTGVVTFSSAAPIILGQNIGTCVTALISSIGANKNAKKAAVVHLLFNVLGTMVFLPAIYLYQHFIGFSFWDSTINRGAIADFHTLFNISNTIMLIPFAGLLVKFSHMIVGAKDGVTRQNNLDIRFLTTPTVAVSQAVKEVARMGKISQQNVLLSIESVMERITAHDGKIEDNENAVDEMESVITQYLIKLSDVSLRKEENKLVSGLFHVITDFERIADHAMNIAELSTYMVKEGIVFSELAKNELNVISSAVKEIVDLTLAAYENQDIETAMKIQPCEDVIDLLKETLRIRHIDRLAQQKCNLKAGVVFLDIISNLERIADHCSNIGIAIEQLYTPNREIDPHEYLKHLHQTKPKGYDEAYKLFLKKYELGENEAED